MMTHIENLTQSQQCIQIFLVYSGSLSNIQSWSGILRDIKTDSGIFKKIHNSV